MACYFPNMDHFEKEFDTTSSIAELDEKIHQILIANANIMMDVRVSTTADAKTIEEATAMLDDYFRLKNEGKLKCLPSIPEFEDDFVEAHLELISKLKNEVHVPYVPTDEEWNNAILHEDH